MRLRLPPVLILLAALVLSASVAGIAYAGDDKGSNRAKPKDYVAHLTADELKFLRTKLKSWDKLDAHKKQRIAHNVLRIRNLGPKERERFKKRLEGLRPSGSDAAPRDIRWKRFRDHATRVLLTRGLGQAALQRLGRKFEMQMARRDISRHAFEVAFQMTFWGAVGDRAFPEGKPPAPETLPADAPKKFREYYAREYAAYVEAKDPKQKRNHLRRLGTKLALMKGEQLRADLARSDIRSPEAYVAAVGARVSATWREAFQASLKNPEQLLSKAEQVEVRRGLTRLLRRDGRLDYQETALLGKLVERWAIQKHQKGDTESSSSADAILRMVLKDFGVPAAELEALPSHAEPKKRGEFLKRLFEKHPRLMRIFQHRRKHDGARGKNRGRNGTRTPGRGLDGLKDKKPAGVSDADWRATILALKNRLKGRTIRPGAPMAKPDGVSEEAWPLIRKALTEHFEAVRDRMGKKRGRDGRDRRRDKPDKPDKPDK